MSGRRFFRYLAAVSAVAGLACGDYTALTSPPAKKVVNTSAPVGAAFSRYILISGAQVCVEGCGTDSKSQNEGLRAFSGIDSLRISFP
jgi:hypothetical protein